jgi:hypothetical protein
MRGVAVFFWEMAMSAAGLNAVRVLVFAAAVGALSGCGGRPTAAPAPPANLASGLKQLGEVYQYLAHERQPAPTKLADFSTIQPDAMPDALPLIQSGDIVIVWGGGYAASSDKIIAYDKETPTKGGKVLTQSGNVKEMTADEFKAAPKAK